MEPLASVVDRIKGFAESGKQFVQSAIRTFQVQEPDRKNPTEILKRLQRESFTDIMKLRDRQDKLERALLSYKINNISPFSDSSTNLKAIINLSGALYSDRNNRIDRHTTLDGEEINRGIDSRFIFKTSLRESDNLMAEIVTSGSNIYHGSEVTGSPLLLSKVVYSANLTDSVSVISVPMGAKCEDFRIDSHLMEVQFLPTFSSFRPPQFNKFHSCATGLKLKFSNFSLSLAELISSIKRNPNPTNNNRTYPNPTNNNQTLLTTFGQISMDLSDQSKLTISGQWQNPNPISLPFKLGNLQSYPNSNKNSIGCLSAVLEIDQDTKFGGWIELQKSNPSLFDWAVSLADMPEGEVGWSVSVGGGSVSVGGGRKGGERVNRVQLESFLSFDLGKKAKLQPGIVFNLDGKIRAPAIVFRSSWSM